MRAWAVVVVFALAGCLQHELVPCGDQLCPVGSFCTPRGCVIQDQIDVCRGLPDGSPCQVLDLPPGQCVEGTCEVAECGNAVVEATEVCDDGNTVAGDGCSFDCLSNETCGNGVIDLVNGEQCDSAVPGLSHDGCGSICVSELEIWQDATPNLLPPTSNARMVYDEARDEIVMFGGLRSLASNETWVFKDGGWAQHFPASSPEPRHSHSMVYSPKLGKVVLYGGANGGTRFGSVWTWDGVEWTKLSTNDGPGDRSGAAMAYYDGPAANDEVIMLYGGTTGLGVRDDTWQFDGAQWTQLAPVATPKSTFGDHPYVDMFFDPRNQSLWLIGGDVGAGHLYRWQANTWEVYELLTGASAPVPHIQTSLGRLGSQPVLYGGQLYDGSFSNATYTWNIDGYWDLITPSSPPSARFRTAAAWNADGMLIFGGTAGDVLVNHTYRLEPPSTQFPAGQWLNVPTTPQPAKRAVGAATWDGRRGDFLMVGGADFYYASEQTWRWHTSGWKLMVGNIGPRTLPSIAYDEAREEAVLFGGYLGCGSGSGGGSGSGSGSGWGCGVPGGGSGSGSGSGVGPDYVEYDDTYVLRDTTWEWKTSSLRPPKRSDGAMTYVPGHGSLLFGGTKDAIRLGDTWLWTGTDWTNLAPTNPPPPMTGSRLAFDRSNNSVVMYGGAGALGTVWVFDIETLVWSEITPAQGPEARANPVFVYNARRGRMLLFGGTLPNGQVIADTWELDVTNRSWERRHPVGTPPARGEAFAVYDQLNARIIMFGGRGQLSTVFDDVWTYSFESNTPAIERCDGADGDGDALLDCADPDCYPRCDPYCPPATTCVDPRPKCGDGICAPVEAGTCADCP